MSRAPDAAARSLQPQVDLEMTSWSALPPISSQKWKVQCLSCSPLSLPLEMTGLRGRLCVFTTLYRAVISRRSFPTKRLPPSGFVHISISLYPARSLRSFSLGALCGTRRIVFVYRYRKMRRSPYFLGRGVWQTWSQEAWYVSSRASWSATSVPSRPPRPSCHVI